MVGNALRGERGIDLRTHEIVESVVVNDPVEGELGVRECIVGAGAAAGAGGNRFRNGGADRICVRVPRGIRIQFARDPAVEQPLRERRLNRERVPQKRQIGKGHRVSRLLLRPHRRQQIVVVRRIGIGNADEQRDIRLRVVAHGAAETDEPVYCGFDRRELQRIVERAAARHRVGNRDMRRPTCAARDRLRHHRHPEFVSSGFDRNAIFQPGLRNRRLQRADVFDVKSNRARVVLPER